MSKIIVCPLIDRECIQEQCTFWIKREACKREGFFFNRTSVLDGECAITGLVKIGLMLIK